MAVYGFTITTEGAALLARLQANSQTLNLSRVQFGTGKHAGTTKSDLASQTQLISPLGNGEKGNPIYADGHMFLTFQYRNDMNGGISSMTNLNEFGIWATDPTNGNAEVLYIYGSLGDAPDVLLPYSGGVAMTRKYQISVTMGGVPGVATNFDSVGGYVVSATAPTDKTLLWIDSGHNHLAKFWNGTQWVAATTSIPILSSDPAGAENGQVWVKN